MKIHLKSRFEIALNERGYLHVQSAPTGHAASNSLVDELNVNAGLLGQNQGFRDGLQSGRYNNLIGEFGKTSRADASNPHHALTHFFEDWLYLIKNLFVTTDHNRKGPIDSPGFSTANRCVQHGCSLLREFNSNALGNHRRD